jgi:hypothetical protein
MPFLTGMYQQQAAKYPDDPDAFMREQVEKQRKLREEYEIGEGGKYQKAQEDEIARLEAEVPTREREAKKMDMAEFFFNIAAEASKPGASLLSSIAGAGPGYVKQTRASKKELDALQSEARRARMEILKANELERAGDINGAQALYTQGRRDMQQVGSRIAELTVGQQEAEKERTAKREDAASERAFRRELVEFEADARAALKEVEARIEAGKGTSTDVQFGTLYNRFVKAKDKLDQAEPNSEEAKAAQKEINTLTSQINQIIDFETQRRPKSDIINTDRAGKPGGGEGFTVLGSRPAD